MTIQHVVTLKLDVAAQHRLDRLLDLLELAISRNALTPEELREVVDQIRDQTNRLRSTAGDAGRSLHPSSPTT